MIYTDLTRKAMKIAFSAHDDQYDKSNIPYIFHPIHVAEQMDDEISAAVALLHDVVEDADISVKGLFEMGFPRSVIKPIALLTRSPNVTYEHYIEDIAKDEVARKVKIADLMHNADLTRLPNPTDADRERAEKYKVALATLTG